MAHCMLGATPRTNIEVLVDNKYLKAAPASTEYTITLNSTSGAASGDLSGGAVTANCTD